MIDHTCEHQMVIDISEEYHENPFEELLEEWETVYDMDLEEMAELRDDRYDLIDELEHIADPLSED